MTSIVVPLDLVRFMNIEGRIPDPHSTPGSNRTKEEVGTGDGSTTVYYLNNGFVINNSYVLYYGSTESGATSTLTEGTHFTLDRDLGKITLTTAGTAALTTNKIYAKYSYSTIGLSDTQMTNAIDRAEAEVEDICSNKWVDGGTATPSYAQITNEEHTGKGRFDRDYFLRHYPLPDVSTVTGTAVAGSATTIYVASTDGFPESGYINICNDKIQYTGKSSTTFTGCTSVDDAQVSSAAVYPYIFEMSTTSPGSSPSWTVLQKDIDYDIRLENGRVHIYRDDIVLDTLSATTYPPPLVPNRFRATYIWGNSTIPNEVKRLILMKASKELMHTAVRKAVANGMGDFRPENLNVDDAEIERLIEKHKNISSRNT